MMQFCGFSRLINISLRGKLASFMSGIGLDMDRTMNEITRFAKVRPVLFIMMASIGAFSSIPIGTFLVFMVISLATAFISFFVVAGLLLGFGALMLAIALVVVACVAIPPALMLISFYLGTAAIMKLTSSCWSALQGSHVPGSKNFEPVPLFPGQGGSNKIELPDYMKRGEGDSQPLKPENLRN
ncbi:hypothetical protein QYM36_008041 [Artemia franciscana]|uniref:Uncharacterized protein n=1 Tax=Artemia franciscana TaxID=6661 RepID=A0AA88IVJ8_ARTSF|nr:hypothetical protein QYM36_008041 [Artemia franciscana]